MNIYHVEYYNPDYDHTSVITTSKNQALGACLSLLNTESFGSVCVDVWRDGEIVDGCSWIVGNTNIKRIEEYLEKIDVES